MKRLKRRPLKPLRAPPHLLSFPRVPCLKTWRPGVAQRKEIFVINKRGNGRTPIPADLADSKITSGSRHWASIRSSQPGLYVSSGPSTKNDGSNHVDGLNCYISLVTYVWLTYFLPAALVRMYRFPKADRFPLVPFSLSNHKHALHKHTIHTLFLWYKASW